MTLDQVKAALGIPAADTSQDASLQAQIASVSQAINRYLDRIVPQQMYRDQFRYLSNCNYPGEPLQLRQYPIAVDGNGDPLASITEDGVAVDPAYYEADTDRGLLYRLDGADPYGWAGALIIVDYTAGYLPIPEDIQAAALDWVAARYHSQGRDPALRSETIPDILTQVYAGESGAGTAGGAIPAAARNLLEPYRLYSL
ncbi:MAG TPA: phage head-tail connector protein [Bradyrhizobium sp.]|nr:phage head-tail connector protein [Bradyrhizobium sp.]